MPKTNPQGRLYWPIWNELKTHGECLVTCGAAERKRVHKAVIKEKWRDAAWLMHAPYAKLEIRHTSSGIKFTLTGAPIFRMHIKEAALFALDGKLLVQKTAAIQGEEK